VCACASRARARGFSLLGQADGGRAPGRRAHGPGGGQLPEVPDVLLPPVLFVPSAPWLLWLAPGGQHVAGVFPLLPGAEVALSPVVFVPDVAPPDVAQHELPPACVEVVVLPPAVPLPAVPFPLVALPDIEVSVLPEYWVCVRQLFDVPVVPPPVFVLGLVHPAATAMSATPRLIHSTLERMAAGCGCARLKVLGRRQAARQGRSPSALRPAPELVPAEGGEQDAHGEDDGAEHEHVQELRRDLRDALLRHGHLTNGGSTTRAGLGTSRTTTCSCVPGAAKPGST
jgi:hypothetical protein